LCLFAGFGVGISILPDKTGLVTSTADRNLFAGSAFIWRFPIKGSAVSVI
jgi:hypothetical protein